MRGVCNNRVLYKFGLKLFCESENEDAISCFENLNAIKTVNIQCASGYYNEDDIKQQTIICQENDQWSNIPMICLPKCGGHPNTVELIYENQKKPTWYAEIIGKNNLVYPGIILFEREILTRCKYFMGNDNNNYNIRIQKNYYKINKITPFRTYLIPDENCDNCSFDELCGISLEDGVFIRYDKNIQPACSPANSYVYSSKFLEFFDTKFQENRINQFIPALNGECTVPHVDNTKTEVNCFKAKNSGLQTFEPIECARRADLIITHCRIGYQSRLSNQKDYLARCIRNDWQYVGGKENTCDLICGTVDSNYRPSLTPLISSGTKANIIQVPWHVGIYANNTQIVPTIQQVCGGTIIHSNIIISAAHCVYDRSKNKLLSPSSYLVGAGKTYRTYEIAEEYDHFAKVIDLHIPPNYHPSEIYNDIAILILDHHLKYTSHIKPICIDWESFNNQDIKAGTQGIIAGWGATSKDDIQSTELLIANFTTVTNNECKKLVDPNHRSDITGDKFCATSEKKASACRGDSGGGFVYKKNIGYGERYYFGGVVSIGYNIDKYCSDDFLTLFTNIQLYQDLIKSVVLDSRNSKLF
ncbi:uncharacterized protein LOC129618542 [Condylostylus longicornis]|uniref:uncharacterized protein LOC129618542 n=1 Tax=Condylostylus longicornis TaxID=2530218 RepID=UPI00244E0716|nr:uncharacterized protein LOC129618542 [Condylostylus longicornis]